MTFRERLAAICATLPGAEVSDPWGGGHDAWKVGGKLFAVAGAATPGVSVKCPDVETADLLIGSGLGRRAPYLRGAWVNLSEDAPDDELAHRVRASYALIRAALPKRVRDGLAPMEPA